MIGLAILGATGSVGMNALRVAEVHPGLVRVELISGHKNSESLLKIIERFRPRRAFITGGPADGSLVARAAKAGCELSFGGDALLEAVGAPEISCVLLAITGAAGLSYGLRALECGKRLAIANKEPLVIAGKLFLQTAEKGGGEIVPVDSEHSAIFQCLEGKDRNDVARIILTTSGGPFHGLAEKDFAGITASEALHHPTWKMGSKITIDSATMMNKALEIIEARWLFGMPLDRIAVTVHRQSIVHSMVEYMDGSIMAQLGETDMRLPILYALSHPRRWPSGLPSMDFSKSMSMTFEPLNPVLGRAIELARDFGEDNAASVMMNAVNEVFVSEFLQGRASFTCVYGLVRKVVEDGLKGRHSTESLGDIIALDGLAREAALGRLAAERN